MYNYPISPHPTPEPWHIRDTIFQWGHRTYVMGVLNVTPDSFSDGGKYHSLPSALTHAHRLVAAGADLLDVGGQSTRPGAVTISLEEELERVIPIIRAIRQGTNEFPPFPFLFPWIPPGLQWLRLLLPLERIWSMIFLPPPLKLKC